MILMFYEPKIIEIYNIIILTKKYIEPFKMARGNILKEIKIKKFERG